MFKNGMRAVHPGEVLQKDYLQVTKKALGAKTGSVA
jgi:plasmid maintenance system antidote protein VapI